MNSVQLITQAHRLLEKAKTLPEIKEVRDKANAIISYLQQQQDVSHDVVLSAKELKVRAER